MSIEARLAAPRDLEAVRRHLARDSRANLLLIDLVDRLGDTCRWLIGGHIAHVTVMLPGDQRIVAQHHDELTSLGLFPAGWLPGYLSGGRDALTYQALAWSDLDPKRIQVVGERARQIRTGVLQGWKRAQMFDPMGAPRRGRVSVKVA